MTFINRRIIKRPTLFATSRRNFGNLLTHYETGQDGTTPEPGPEPEPEPVTFTTSWSTNGGIVKANFTGISSHRTTEVIVLTRGDGTVLATLDENKVGDWDLQHDEGTGYSVYTYNIRLDGVIKSSFARTYEPDTPSFTTNFFSNSAKTISCGVENITNPSGLFTIQLARIDGAVLDSHVLNDATSFFLQFTELDYGTYDYQVLLNDTQVATHTHLFDRPEPTFTTSWTKSGLSITADLSSVVGAHPDFYAYLCRDDGTTLATHQFTEGQTTTSLSFTEADYGSFTYQLKLGTTVVSTHTESYVRPTPAYSASFSTNELTLTASITSITNAHNSFAITLERDDGTVLQTRTLVEGETSFTFTQTETSYATFNYIVKLNGTQTDTYSATYTAPPTPTFDIVLTNDDLAITATLANIVNPDPYYTLMIHDVNDTHLDGHTFTTGDTTVTLTWTETTYGEKTYTKLLNGVSIGTEAIALTDPNASTPTTPPDTLPNVAGTTQTYEYKYRSSDVNYYYYDRWAINSGEWANAEMIWGINNKSNAIKVGKTQGHSDYNTWLDAEAASTNYMPPHTVAENGANIELKDTNSLVFYAFINPYYEAPPTPTQITNFFASHASGDYQTQGCYTVIHSSSTSSLFVYQIGNPSWGGLLADHTISYDTNSKIWADVGSSNPYYVCDGSSWADTTASSTNQQTVSFWQNNTAKLFELTNPYYEPPTLVSSINITNGKAFNNENYTSYIHRSTDTTNSRYIYALGNTSTSTAKDIAYEWVSQKWVDIDTNATHNTFGNSVSDTANTSRETSANPQTVYVMETYWNLLYAVFTNPYYEA